MIDCTKMKKVLALLLGAALLMSACEMKSGDGPPPYPHSHRSGHGGKHG